MRRHGMENKLKTRAKSRKNKNRKGFVGDKSSSETDDVLGGCMKKHNILSGRGIHMDHWVQPLHEGTISWHCNAELIWAVGPAEVWWPGFSGSITSGCTKVGQAVLCWVQSGTPMGMLPSMAALWFALSSDGTRSVLWPLSGFRFELATV